MSQFKSLNWPVFGLEVYNCNFLYNFKCSSFFSLQHGLEYKFLTYTSSM